MTDKEYKQFEYLFNKLSIELKHSIFVVQSIHDGWQIGRYDGNGSLVDTETSFSIKDCHDNLLAKDVTKKLIPHDIIG